MRGDSAMDHRNEYTSYATADYRPSFFSHEYEEPTVHQHYYDRHPSSVDNDGEYYGQFGAHAVPYYYYDASGSYRGDGYHDPSYDTVAAGWSQQYHPSSSIAEGQPPPQSYNARDWTPPGDDYDGSSSQLLHPPPPPSSLPLPAVVVPDPTEFSDGYHRRPPAVEHAAFQFDHLGVVSDDRPGTAAVQFPVNSKRFRRNPPLCFLPVSGPRATTNRVV